MDELNPMSLMIALKTMGKPVSMLCAHRRRLLPVFIGTYLLHLVLTALLVNLASPVVNLDSMGPLYEIDGNSILPSSKLHLTVTGELFWTLSSAITMVSFSKAFREDSRRAGTRKVQQSRSIATPIWRKWYGFAHVVVTWVALVQLLYEILEANKLGLFHISFTSLTPCVCSLWWSRQKKASTDSLQSKGHANSLAAGWRTSPLWLSLMY